MILISNPFKKNIIFLYILIKTTWDFIWKEVVRKSSKWTDFFLFQMFICFKMGKMSLFPFQYFFNFWTKLLQHYFNWSERSGVLYNAASLQFMISFTFYKWTLELLEVVITSLHFREMTLSSFLSLKWTSTKSSPSPSLSSHLTLWTKFVLIWTRDGFGINKLYDI